MRLQCSDSCHPPGLALSVSFGQPNRDCGDRSGSTRVFRVGRDRSFTARHGGSRCVWPLSHDSLTFMEAPAAEVKVGLTAVSVSSPDRHTGSLRCFAVVAARMTV